jgi:signal transduction histidine kinase
MAIRDAEGQDADELAALLTVARLVANEVPEEVVFAAVAEQVAGRVGSEAASVLRFIGDERAVVVGVWREGGNRGLPVNAELDFSHRNSALGQVRRTRRPARADSYEGSTGELPLVMRSIELRSTVAAPVLLGAEVWGAVVASTTRDEPLPAGSETRIDVFAELAAQAVANRKARERLIASSLRIVEAADASRRRLERDLHEGTQQHLLALTLTLRVARDRTEPGSELEHLLGEALAEAAEANDALSMLARALHPIVLTERGLAPALQALAARVAVPVHLHELPSRRFPATTETTAYFVVADVLAEAAPDSRPAVIAGDRGDRLVIEVRDDGVAAADRRLPGLAERVAAVGGHLAAGAGVRAEFPL